MKIQIIGASGTGKSTLAEYLSAKTGVYWIDTDKYLWKDRLFTENHALEDRIRMYRNDTAAYPDYIVSGSVHSWLPEGFSNRELLVLLTMDEDARMKRLYDREYARFGHDMLPGGDHFELTREFLDWCKTYTTADAYAVNSLACHQRLLREASCSTLVLNADQSVEALGDCVFKAYSESRPG
jgi:adenylate kinase family enzyme